MGLNPSAPHVLLKRSVSTVHHSYSRGTTGTSGEIYNLPVNLFNFPVKQEKRCINPPLRAGDRVRVRVRVS